MVESSEFIAPSDKMQMIDTKTDPAPVAEMKRKTRELQYLDTQNIILNQDLQSAPFVGA